MPMVQTKNTTLTLLSQAQITEFYRAGYWCDDTIYSLAHRRAADAPQAFAVRDRLRRITYGQLIAAADRLASELHRSGVRTGQRVAVWASSRVETAVALLACSRNGYACCPSLHRDHTVGDVVGLLQRMRAAAFIGELAYGADGQLHNLFELLPTIGTIRHIVSLAPIDSPDSLADDLLRDTGLDSTSLPVSTDPNRVVYLAFTSGTTGQPKGVMHSDNTLLANARAIARSWSFGPASVLYTMSPLSHNLGFGAMVTALSTGGELVVHDLPRGASVLNRLIETEVSFLFGVPTHAIDLLSELRARNLPKLGALKGFRISGAPAPPEVVAELLQRGVVPQSGYGMTEACSHHYTLPSDDSRRIFETSGRACPGYEVKIWSLEDPELEVPVGQVGQIGGRGARLMLGYFEDQAATEEAFNSQGWFMTGDIGRLDAEGYLVITGRKKDLIIRGGHNIYPARIENLVMQHPAVARAAVFPIPDPRLGEKVCLAVMPHPQGGATAMELLEHLDSCGLSRYEMPEYFVELTEIPLTASGKIYKRDLIEDVRAGRITPSAVRWRQNIEHDA